MPQPSFITPRFLAACAAVLLPALGALAVLAAPAQAAPVISAPSSCDGAPQRFVLALDGIPYDLFMEAQANGLFADFGPAARLVSSFPSLSDVAFSAIGGSEPPDGYQIMRFDRDSNQVVGNTLGSMSGRAHHHFPFDSREHSAWHRMLGYMVSSAMSRRDLGLACDDVLLSEKETFVAYVESTDMLLHVHGHDKALELLGVADRLLRELSAEVRARTGRDLAIDIVSDHGSTMQEGKPVHVAGLLAECGFKRSKTLEDEHDVAYSLAGIIGCVAIACDPAQSAAVASCLATDEGVDLAAFQRGDAVVVVAAGGEAEIRLVSNAPETYSLRLIQGDPIRLGALAGVDAGAARPVDIVVDGAAFFVATSDAAHPDPLRRLWRAFHGAVKEPSDVLVSLRDGREAGNKTVRGLSKMRGRSGTHGSLSRLSSLGVIVSNWRPVHDVDAWGAHAILFGEPTLLALRERGETEIAAPPAALAAAPTAIPGEQVHGF